MIVEVYRGAGDRAGVPLSEPLLSDDMLIIRGRAEMNTHAHRFIEHTGEVVYRQGMKLGQLAHGPDLTNPAGMTAKITGISISLSLSEGPDPKISLTTTLTLRQPHE